MSHDRFRQALGNLPMEALIDLVVVQHGKIEKLRIMNAVLLSNEATEYARLTAKLFTPTTNSPGEDKAPGVLSEN